MTNPKYKEENEREEHIDDDEDYEDEFREEEE